MAYARSTNQLPYLLKTLEQQTGTLSINLSLKDRASRQRSMFLTFASPNVTNTKDSDTWQVTAAKKSNAEGVPTIILLQNVRPTSVNAPTAMVATRHDTSSAQQNVLQETRYKTSERSNLRSSANDRPPNAAPPQQTTPNYTI